MNDAPGVSQLPGSAVSVDVSFGVPEGAAGDTVFTGGAATRAVAVETALAAPSTLVAVTLTRTVLPTSAGWSV